MRFDRLVVVTAATLCGTLIGIVAAVAEYVIMGGLLIIFPRLRFFEPWHIPNTLSIGVAVGVLISVIAVSFLERGGTIRLAFGRLKNWGMFALLALPGVLYSFKWVGAEAGPELPALALLAYCFWSAAARSAAELP